MFSSSLPPLLLLKISALSVSSGKDEISWSLSSNGEYSVSSGYELIKGWSDIQDIDMKVYDRIWKLKASERVRSFIWLLLKGGILTNVERNRQHLSTTSSCACCNADDESLCHLFRDCRWVVHGWNRVLYREVVNEFFSLLFSTWIRSNLLNLSVFASDLEWSSFFAILLWSTWKWRNEWVFNGKCMSEDRIDFIMIYAREYNRANDRNDTMNKEARKVLKFIKWSAPDEGWIKLNFDGAVEDGGVASAAGVIRDNFGRWI